MSICINNKSDQDKFDILASIIGVKEAERDFVEQDGVVRPPRIVIAKLHNRLNDSTYDTLFDKNDQDFLKPIPSDPVTEQIEKIVTDYNTKKSMEVMEAMSKQLGIEYHVVTEKDARDTHKQTENVPGFYQSGNVYFVENQISSDNVFHEFSHPIIKSLSKDKNGQKLFNKLYADLLGMDIGKKIVSDMKQDSFYGANVSSDSFKEEAIVRAMTNIYMNSPVQNESWMKNLMYAIKQFLRRSFGKSVNVSKLSASTTLSQLVDMLNKGEQFKLDLDVLKKDDVLMLQKDFDRHFDLVNDASRKTAQGLMNEMSSMVRSQVAGMVPGSKYASFAEGFVNEENADGLLQEMRFALEKFTSINNNRKLVPGIDNLSQEYIDSVEAKDATSIIAERLAMFIGVISKADTVMDLFSDKVDSLPKGKMTKASDIDPLFGISQYVNQWSNYIDNVISHDSQHLYAKGENSLYEFLLDLQIKINSLKDRVDALKIEGVTDVLYKSVIAERKQASDKMLAEIAHLKKIGNIQGYSRAFQEYYGMSVENFNRMTVLENKNSLSKKETDELNELEKLSFNSFTPTREQFKMMLMDGGLSGSHLNLYYEGYNNAQDKVVGGFFSYIENILNEINANANKNEAEFQHGLKKHFKATGWNLKRQAGGRYLGRALSQISNKGAVDQEGNVQNNEVYEFLNNFEGQYSFEMKALSVDIKNAEKEYHHNPSDANHIEYIKAKNALDDFLADYMTQEMVPEFYESRKLFRDDIGIRALMRLDRFYETSDDMSEVALEAHLDVNASEVILEKRREYEYMFSLTDIYGKMKTGLDLEISKRLLEYRDLSRDFYESETDNEKFQLAYDQMLFDLESKFEVGTKAYLEAIDTWLEHNTTISVDEKWFDERSRLLDKLKVLLEPLTEKNNKIKNVGEIYDEISALSKPSKNTAGEYNGTILTIEVQRKITHLHEDIEEANRDLLSMSGLTNSEMDVYASLVEYLDENGDHNSYEDQLLYAEYKNRISKGLTALGISKADVKEIEAIQDILRKMSISTSTDYYRDTFGKMLPQGSGPASELLDKFLDEYGVDREAGDVITDGIFVEILQNTQLIDEMMSLDTEFEKWFNNNHYKGSRYVAPNNDNEKGGRRIVYLKTNIWKNTSPSNDSYFNSFALKDVDGNVIGAIRLRGVPRVPNTNYQVRKVKDEFLTTVIENDYVDSAGNLILANKNNKGEWLPKTVDQGAVSSKFVNQKYQEMFDTDRPMWDMLDYFKKHHLKSQEGLSNSQKLGLEYPRSRASKMEAKSYKNFINNRAGSTKEMFTTSRVAESLKNITRAQEDDAEFGLNSMDNSSKELYQLQTLTRPITGMYNLGINEVSTDIVELMGKYQYSVETFKAFGEINSFAQSLQQMVSSQISTPEAREIKRKSDILELTSKDGKVSARAFAIGNIIDANFKGLQLKKPAIKGEKGQNYTKAQALALRKLMGWSSFKWFFLNWMSDYTNYASGQLQMVYKLADSTYFTPKNLLVGSIKSKKAINLVTRKQYSAGSKPLIMQFLDVMDASPDRFKTIVGERGSRTLLQDVGTLRPGFGVRAYLQDEINYKALYALLDNKKNRFMLNGEMVTLDKSVELVNGVIQSKAGVPKGYQITYDANGKVIMGTEVIKLIKKQHGYLKKIMGIAGRSAESDFINRNLLGKMIFFIMRFLPGMTMDRYQFSSNKKVDVNGVVSKRINKRRYDWYTGTNEYGTFIEALLSVKFMAQGLVQATGGNVKGNQIRRIVENRRVLSGLTQTIMAVMVNMLIDMLLGKILFNAGDDDQFTFDQTVNGVFTPGEKVKGMIAALKKTTARPNLPFVEPGLTDEMIGRDFDYGNFWKLQGVRLLLRLERENKTINPNRLWPSVFNLATSKSAIQEGATKDIQSLIRIGMDMAAGEETIIKKTAGPYVWQQKGKHKFPHEFFSKFVGFNGNLLSPADGIESEIAFPF